MCFVQKYECFDTRDELEYQTARNTKERRLANDLQRQGIGENDYPRYGTNFWGNSANNYGFGIRNIGQNVYTSKVNDKELKIVTSPIRRGNIVSSIYYPNK